MDYNKLTDQEILEQLRSGDHAAFNEIHNRHFDAMLRFSYNLIHDKEACNDMVQDVLIWFWEHRELQQLENIRAYLLTALKYQAAKFIRKGKVREVHLESLSRIDSYSQNEERLEVEELKKIISSFVHQLPEKCAVIFKMSREEHMTNRQIAAKLGISESTVAVQVKRALDKLKKNLGHMHFWIYFFI